MFTKNIKLIGIVALIVVIVMVLSAVIAINNDKKVAGELGTSVEEMESSYEKKIAELNAAIANLKTALGKVEAGLADANTVIAAQKELIEKLGAEEASEYTFDKVIAVGTDDGITVGAPYVAGASVSAKVVKNGKAKKITVMTYKPKKNSKRKMGHRQPYTKVEIAAINA